MSSNNYETGIRAEFTFDMVRNCETEDIFQSMVRAANGGTYVRSAAAPSLSSEFTKSSHNVRAQAGVDGSFADIEFPSRRDIVDKVLKKHGQRLSLGYDHTQATAAYSGGLGERSARALAREETTYQLKGTFPSAMLSFAKLRARIEARDGDVTALDKVFAQFWGMMDEAVDSIPKLHVDGSEITRCSAMEDRAYHSLSGHPGHNGGYRVDTVTLVPDALGSNVAINWPRIRVALKALASYQIQGDIEMRLMLSAVQKRRAVHMFMDLVSNSQPRYQRPYPWERIICRILQPTYEGSLDRRRRAERADLGFTISQDMADAIDDRILSDDRVRIEMDVAKIAKTVATQSTLALEKTIAVMLDFDRERATVDELREEELEAVEQSQHVASFHIPRYKLTRSTLQKGLYRPSLGRDDLPDMQSHGPSHTQLNMHEFREAEMNIPITVPGALHMAAYLTTVNPTTRPTAYVLMSLVKDTKRDPSTKSAVRLRKQELYCTKDVRALGTILLSDVFINTLALLIKNMTNQYSMTERSVKESIWNYLSQRCKVKRHCPVEGGWQDLIHELRELDEGWTLYYWMRITIGRMHHTTTSGIMAPIAAGEVVDFATLIKRSVVDRAKRWHELYTSKYKIIEDKLSKYRQAERLRSDEIQRSTKYIPPHLRTMADIEQRFDADELLSRGGGYKEEQYKQMVEMQSKAKFFSKISVHTSGSRIAVGLSDDVMLNMLIEFYQARWYSLKLRIDRAIKEGKKFRLGPHKFKKHPWGELENELPSNVDDMLAFMASLDARAWTIPPNYLQKKFQKSVKELWADIARDIQEIIDYITALHEGLVEEQEIACEESNSRGTLQVMAGIPAIPLPVPGYMPPHYLPEKNITVSGGKASNTAQASPSTFIAGQDDDEEEVDNNALDPVDDDDDDLLMYMTEECSEIPVTKVKFLTYREIWHYLSMPQKSDAEIKFAMRLPFDASLDDENITEELGPMLQEGEESQVPRKWAKARAVMEMRLGLSAKEAVADDM